MVNDVHANLLGALAGISRFGTQILDQKDHVISYSLVVGLEIFGVEIIDGPPEILILEEGVQNVFF